MSLPLPEPPVNAKSGGEVTTYAAPDSAAALEYPERDVSLGGPPNHEELQDAQTHRGQHRTTPEASNAMGMLEAGQSREYYAKREWDQDLAPFPPWRNVLPGPGPPRIVGKAFRQTRRQTEISSFDDSGQSGTPSSLNRRSSPAFTLTIAHVSQQTLPWPSQAGHSRRRSF